MNSVHFSTGKDDWGTPQDLFDALNEEFNFTLDPCADNNNHKCAKYYTIEQDGLAQSWAGETVFCNPPYSRKTKTNAGQIAWVQKCYKEATEGGIVVVMLIPARTDTIMFHDYILGKAEIRFIKGRVNFEIDGQKSKDPAPFPSMIVVFNGKQPTSAVKSIAKDCLYIKRSGILQGRLCDFGFRALRNRRNKRKPPYVARQIGGGSGI